MTAGIEVYNDSGVLQISDYTSNLALIDKGYIDIQTGPYRKTINFPATQESLFFVRPANVTPNRPPYPHTPCAVVQPGVFGASWNSCHWWRFTLAKYVPVPPGSTAGFQVFDENGDTVFHSGQNILNIFAIYDIPAWDEQTGEWRQLPHNNFAFCLINPCLRGSGMIGAPGWWIDCIYFDYPNNRFAVVPDVINVLFTDPIAAVLQPYPYKLLVIDTTNL